MGYKILKMKRAFFVISLAVFTIYPGIKSWGANSNTPLVMESSYMDHVQAEQNKKKQSNYKQIKSEFISI